MNWKKSSVRNNVFIYYWRCSGPEEYKGHSLESLTQDKQIVNCSQTIDEDDVSNEDMDDRIKPIPVTSSNVGLMIVSMSGILIIIGGVACMGKHFLHFQLN